MFEDRGGMSFKYKLVNILTRAYNFIIKRIPGGLNIFIREIKYAMFLFL